MPTTKKTDAPKAPAKKASTKKAPAKAKAPAKPKVEVAAPAPAPKPVKKIRSVYLLTNSGETTLTFSDDASFEAAMAAIKSAPSSGGSRSMGTYDIGGYKFKTVLKYEVTEH